MLFYHIELNIETQQFKNNADINSKANSVQKVNFSASNILNPSCLVKLTRR